MWRSDKCVYGWHMTKPNLCLPSSFLVILPLCLLSPTYSGFFFFFFPWHPFFTFSKIHIQWAWKINGSCGKLATVYICLGWLRDCSSGLVVTIVSYKYKFLAEFQSHVPLVFHIWVMKGSCCNFISIQFQTRWQPFMSLCHTLGTITEKWPWFMGQLNLEIILTIVRQPPNSSANEVFFFFFFSIADNMGIPYRGEQCPLSVWPALKFHRWREERKVSNPWPNSQSLERAGKGAACLWPPCQLAWLVTEMCQKGKVCAPSALPCEA